MGKCPTNHSSPTTSTKSRVAIARYESLLAAERRRRARTVRGRSGTRRSQSSTRRGMQSRRGATRGPTTTGRSTRPETRPCRVRGSSATTTRRRRRRRFVTTSHGNVTTRTCPRTRTISRRIAKSVTRIVANHDIRQGQPSPRLDRRGMGGFDPTSTGTFHSRNRGGK